MSTFCTKQEIRDRNFEIDVAKHAQLTDAWLDTIIDDKSGWVQDMLYNTQGAIPDLADTPATPIPIQRLAIYACMESALIRMYSQLRIGDGSDILYWQDEKKMQLTGILSHRISGVGMIMPAFGSNKKDKNWKPAFGYNQYGQRMTSSEQQEEDQGFEARDLGQSEVGSDYP